MGCGGKSEEYKTPLIRPRRAKSSRRINIPWLSALARAFRSRGTCKEKESERRMTRVNCQSFPAIKRRAHAVKGLNRGKSSTAPAARITSGRGKWIRDIVAALSQESEMKRQTVRSPGLYAYACETSFEGQLHSLFPARM